jgi:hypothetical protein
MVRTVRWAGFVAGLTVFGLGLAGGCQNGWQAAAPVELALKFVSGQTGTYKVVSEAQKSVEWLGSPESRPAAFKDGRAGHRVEIMFEQQVQEVREDGSADVQITIEALKYTGGVQGNVGLDFDSARDRDPNNPLAKLIGKSYRLQISAQGQVLALLDVEPVRQAVRGDSLTAGTALKLLSDEVIRERHEIPPLMALKEARVRPGQTWSDIKTFSFAEMGVKSHERVYTLTGLRHADGRVAVVKMKAIPSAATAAQVHREQTGGLFSGLADNTGRYEGRLELDLDSGSVRVYSEEMRTEWVVVDPSAAPESGRPPAIKMAAGRLHRIERVP